MKIINKLMVVSLLTVVDVLATDTFSLILNDLKVEKQKNIHLSNFKNLIQKQLDIKSKYILNKNELKSFLRTISFNNDPNLIYTKIKDNYIIYQYPQKIQKVSLLSYFIDANLNNTDLIKSLLDVVFKDNNSSLYGNILNISYNKNKDNYLDILEYISNHKNKNAVNFLKTDTFSKKISIYDFSALSKMGWFDMQIIKKLHDKGVVPNLYELENFFNIAINQEIKENSNSLYIKVNNTIKNYLKTNSDKIVKNYCHTFMIQGDDSFIVSLNLFYDLNIKEYFYTLATKDEISDKNKDTLLVFLKNKKMEKFQNHNITSYSFDIAYKNQSNNYIQGEANNYKELKKLKIDNNKFLENFEKYTTNIYQTVKLKDKKIEYKPSSLSRKTEPYGEHLRVYLSFKNNYISPTTDIKYKVTFKDNKNNKILSKTYTDKIKIEPNSSNKMDSFWYFENDEFVDDEKYDKLLPYFIKNNLIFSIKIIEVSFEDNTKLLF